MCPVLPQLLPLASISLAVVLGLLATVALGVDISMLLSDKYVHWLVKKSILLFPGTFSTGELMDYHISSHAPSLQFCYQFVSLA